MEEGYVSAEQAAGILGTSKRAVRGVAGRGEPEARREGEVAAARPMIPVASVDGALSGKKAKRAPGPREPAVYAVRRTERGGA